MDWHKAAPRIACGRANDDQPCTLKPIFVFLLCVLCVSVVNKSFLQPDLPRLIPAFRRAMNAAIGGPSQSWVLTNW